MKKDAIIQFVSFSSNLEPVLFVELWKPFANLLVKGSKNTLLQCMSDSSSNRFNYISQHISAAADFSFAFMKGKSRSQFPEQKASIRQAGGYSALQIESNGNKPSTDMRVIAFVAHRDNDLGFYRGLSVGSLNIYEAYFENCTHGYIMEYFLQEKDAPVLLTQLKERTGVEAALFKECRLPALAKKVSGALS